MEPLPEADRNAARNRARDELSLAWDETLANNPMTPRTRPHRLRWWFLWFLQATESGTQPAPSYLPFSSVPAPSLLSRFSRSPIVAKNKVKLKLALGMVFLSAYSGERAFR